MPTIFDLTSRWLGTSPYQLIAGNKRPVTIDDTLVVVASSGPVSVDVLANDFDPEGGALTLISANAALGSAVAEADNTVTYTPPPGISGFDTVVYEVADTLDQRQSGQINVTISQPVLSIETTPSNTLEVTADSGLIDIDISTPAAFAGLYQLNVSDLAGGPINLVIPAFSGTVTEGNGLTAEDGLWVFDTTAAGVTQSWQWLRNGIEIMGATTAGYTVTANDLQQTLSVRETLSDANGQRSAVSAGVGNQFDPITDPALVGWWDASDESSITDAAGQVSAWVDKAGGPPLEQTSNQWRPQTGGRSINGLNVIDFDGSQFLERTESLPASGDVAFHMVLSIDAVSSAFAAILAIEAVNDFQLDANAGNQFDGRLNASGIGAPATLSGGPFSGDMILSLMFDRTGTGTADVFISDAIRGTMAYAAPIDAPAALHLMTNRSKNAWIDGAVAELVITGDLNTRPDYHIYLANKWGLN